MIMKNLYLVVASLILSVGVFAQDFEYALGQHRVDKVVNENYESYEIQVVTPTPEDITFKWEIVSNTFDPNWSCSVCDFSGCYVGFPPSATMSPITAAQMAAGTSGFIKCNITCGLHYGDGKVEIYIYDQNDYARGDTVSFSIHWPDPAAASVEENQVRIATYPNPVQHQLSVHNPSAKKGTLVVTDVLGKPVHRSVMYANTTQIVDFADLSKGVYLVTFRGESGAISTKKIIKK